MTTPPLPPGWYPDPGGGGGQRYWDGTHWTEIETGQHGGPPAAIARMPVSDIKSVILPLRLIFWGALIVLVDLTYSQTVNGVGWRFDFVNDAVGMLMIVWGTSRLGKIRVDDRYRTAMRLVTISAVLSLLDAIHGHFIYDTPPTVALFFSVVGFAAMIATVVFCVAMRWLSEGAGLQRSARSWKITTLLFVIVYLIPIGLFYCAAAVAIAMGSPFNIQLGPVGLLLVPVFCVPLIHFFVSTSRMKADAESPAAEPLPQRQASHEPSRTTKRSRILVKALAVITVVAVIAAVVGFVLAWQVKREKDRMFREATSLRLVAEARSMLAQTRPEGDVRAFQQLVAARRIAQTPDDGPLREALMDKMNTLKIIQTPRFVNTVAFSPDGKRIVSGSLDAVARSWDAATGQPIGDLRPEATGQPVGGDERPYGAHDTVDTVAISPDGRRLVTGHRDGTVRLWDVDTGQQVGDPLTAPGVSIADSVAFSPDGKRIVAGCSDSDGVSVRVWDAETGRPVGQPMTGHTKWVQSVAFSPDGKRVVSGSGDRTVRLWDADTGQPIGPPLTGHTAPVESVAFSPDGKRVVSGSRDTTVRLWDAETGQPIGQPMTAHTKSVRSVAFSPDGTRIGSGSADQTVRVWDAGSGQPVGGPLTGHTNWVNSVAFSPDGHQIVSASSDDTVRVWSLDNSPPVGRPLAGDPGTINREVHSVAFSPDGTRIASGDDYGAVRLWDAATGQPVGQPMTSNSVGSDSVAFSPDGRHIASGGGNDVRLWDVDTGQPIGQPMTHSEVRSVAFSPDGRRIASGGGNDVRLWDAGTGQPVGAPLTADAGQVFSVAFSPDGRRIVSGNGNSVRLWDADTGQPIGDPMTGHRGWVYAVAYSPDGTRIASASGDGTVRLWDARTRKPVGDPMTDKEENPVRLPDVLTVAFSPDGKRIASGGYNWNVRLWDAATGRPIDQPLRGSSGVESVAFSPDGNLLVSGNYDGSLRLWLAYPDFVAALCDKLSSNMDEYDWERWVSPDIGYVKACPNLPIPSLI